MTGSTARPRRRSGLRAATAALAASLPLPGCGVFDSGGEVILLGDSLTVLVADAVTAGAGDHDVKVEGT